MSDWWLISICILEAFVICVLYKSYKRHKLRSERLLKLNKETTNSICTLYDNLVNKQLEEHHIES